MPVFRKESLELLRQRIDLVEVITPYVRFVRTGIAYKALCPFHQEKTPSFVVKKGDDHYHCFGCGAHGDAIAFLMDYAKMSFTEAVEALAEKFSVPLEVSETDKKEGEQKSKLKAVMQSALEYYHFTLLHTEQGHKALEYLYKRGIDLDFIKMFEIGYAPSSISIKKLLNNDKYSNQVLIEAGLISKETLKDFFIDRVMIPIRDAMGSVIGFSARSLEEGRGPKYINTPETPLFKKSRVLFGLSYCRKKIAQEKQAIVVEGQIDAMRLIFSGFSITVAGQGTAFGKEHVEGLLHLGVKKVYLALDADNAGKEASEKVGDLFQKEGVEVFITKLPDGFDPDTILLEEGPEKFKEYMGKSQDYLTFLVDKHAKKLDISSPAQKNELVMGIASKIRLWDHPLMVHESLRKLAKLTNTPEAIIGTTSYTKENVQIKHSAPISFSQIDPDKILEIDLLRWLFLMGQQDPNLIELCVLNLKEEDFKVISCKKLYSKYIESYSQKKPLDLLSLAIDLEEQMFLSEVLQKKINKEKAKSDLLQTIEKILMRNWFEKKEEIKTKINSGIHSEDQMMHLAKEFDLIHRDKPKIKEVENV